MLIIARHTHRGVWNILFGRVPKIKELKSIPDHSLTRAESPSQKEPLIYRNKSEILFKFISVIIIWILTIAMVAKFYEFDITVWQLWVHGPVVCFICTHGHWTHFNLTKQRLTFSCLQWRTIWLAPQYRVLLMVNCHKIIKLFFLSIITKIKPP